MSLGFFEQQLRFYAGHHRDARNRATHFIGIPAIIFAVMIPLAQFNVPMVNWPLSSFLAVIAVLGWLSLDVTIGAAMIVVVVPLLVAAEWVASLDGAAPWTTFAVFFVGGWALQLLGHLWEGRRPALADNLFQAYIGPMFLMAEVLVALGLRPELRAVIDSAGE